VHILIAAANHDLSKLAQKVFDSVLYLPDRNVLVKCLGAAACLKLSGHLPANNDRTQGDS